MHSDLPVAHVLPELLSHLRSGRRAVLQAPPGAGKTTLVPPALLAEEWLGDKKIVLLEPRRLAARNAAWRIADLLGEKPGGVVGYRMRGESRVGPTTRVEVLTEGTLTALFRGDPALTSVGVLLFDEFHERSIHADLGLALALHASELFRPDLRIVVMSATLESARVASLLDDAPVVRSEGRAYPVETRYLGGDRDRPVEEATAGAVRRALGETEGDILVFLPGLREIARTALLLDDLGRSSIEVHQLHGSLSRTLQDRALLPSPSGARKVVLSSAVAETSLTIEGITVVIDAGLSRAPRFDPNTGLSRLLTLPVSRASAAQRRGRAGRLAPGVCYRLWDRAEEHAMRPAATPEILETDLLPLALDLLAWGASPEELRWLDPPPSGPYAAALELGRGLGLISAAGGLTESGERAVGLPLHPRLARMVLVASSYDRATLDRGLLLAALIEEGDPVRSGRYRNPDLLHRLDLLERAEREGNGSSRLDRGAADRILRQKGRLARILGDAADEGGRLGYGALLAVAYPDRIAAARAPRSDRYLLAGGRPVRLPKGAPPSDPYLVVAAVGGSGAEGTIELALSITLEEIEEALGEQIREESVVSFDPETGRVEIRSDRLLGSITLSTRTVHDPDDSLIVEGTLEGIRRGGIDLLPWGRRDGELRRRLAFLHHYSVTEEGIAGEWPDVSDDALLERLEEWLRPLLSGKRGRDRLGRLDMSAALTSLLGWREQRDLDRLAPERIRVPSGAQIRIDYGRPEEPVLPVRLQEMFGSTRTPRIAGGRVPLTLHLLSPAHRPVQITRDLEGFWTGSYAEVRKEMKGRYPKHDWPENPGERERG